MRYITTRNFQSLVFFAIGDGSIDWNDDLHLLENEYGIPIITYPSTEIMKDIKMYPPYK